MVNIIEHEDVLTSFFDTIDSKLKGLDILHRYGKSTWENVEFWMIRIIASIEYMRDDKLPNHGWDYHDDEKFTDWFTHQFSGDVQREGENLYQNCIMDIIKEQNKDITSFIKNSPNIVSLYISYENRAK
jgi:hypothetical protein